MLRRIKFARAITFTSDILAVLTFIIGSAVVRCYYTIVTHKSNTLCSLVRFLLRRVLREANGPPV